MGYALAFAATAIEDLDRLLADLPGDRWAAAIDAIEAVCRRFADQPVHRRGRQGEPPTFPVHFEAGGTRYHWAGTYTLSLDERTLVVTHLFRVPL